MNTYAKGPLIAGQWLGCSGDEARENQALLFHKEVEREEAFSASDEVTASQELPRKISRISKPFSAMIAAAVNQASAATHQELANWPILLLSHVNCTSGTSAKGSWKLRTTWLRMSKPMALD